MDLPVLIASEHSKIKHFCLNLVYDAIAFRFFGCIDIFIRNEPPPIKTVYNCINNADSPRCHGNSLRHSITDLRSIAELSLECCDLEIVRVTQLNLSYDYSMQQELNNFNCEYCSSFVKDKNVIEREIKFERDKWTLKLFYKHLDACTHQVFRIYYSTKKNGQSLRSTTDKDGK